ncbi:MAG: DNA repair protein RadA [Patescibacteria group bacterium]|jgi:DNA repair protein RadA/Sms
MFVCSHCDTQYHKWQGRCTECGQWSTIVEESQTTAKPKQLKEAQKAPFLILSESKNSHARHLPTGIAELDRVLSGGLVPGSVTLLAGEPGIGKSTLVAELASTFSKEKPCYYVSGEESEGQVLLRFERLGIVPTSILFSNSTEVHSIIAASNSIAPSLLIIDSIQTMMTDGVESIAGTPLSVRAATAELIQYAKSTNTPVLLIGQMTKDGSVAGPKTLEHLVDTVLTLEGDKNSFYRLLRPSKHRFGSTEEVGVFEMTGKGLVGVENPSARFLEERTGNPGSVVTCSIEGTRPFLLEIQALAEKSVYPNPIRRTSGFDAGRLHMLLAILQKFARANVSTTDVYVNVVGGMELHEPAADAAVCAAILSSLQNKPLPKNLVVMGEMGLGGDIRSIPLLERRKKEAERLGFSHVIAPDTAKHMADLLSLCHCEPSQAGRSNPIE